MSLLNARNPYWITQAQMLAAPVIKSFGVEPLPVGYIVVSPGGTVGWVGDANFRSKGEAKDSCSACNGRGIPGKQDNNNRHRIKSKASGSGPVPKEMIRAVSSSISSPYVVAGGIMTEQDLRDVYSSGGDIAQIGTAFEDQAKALKKVQLFSKIAKEEGAKKKKLMR
jgi:phosphoglycerol geranylgeranyltransferase